MKISVIVPTLNESEHILRCIRSVKEQAPEVELIVVDGGSTDSERCTPDSSTGTTRPADGPDNVRI